MKRYVFFLNYRGGSSLFRHALGDTPSFFPQLKAGPNLLPCSPSCKVVHVGLPFLIEELHKEDEDLAVMTHIGNWWGNLSSSQVPGPYDDDCPMKFSWEQLENLIKTNSHIDYKFVYLIRDGRNQIESLRNLKGGCEEEFNKANSEDYFKALSLGWRNQAQIAIDCQINLPSQFKIYKFTDMMTNPTSFFLDLFSYLELVPDIDLILSRIQEMRAAKLDLSHSSFGNDKDYNRWKKWTDEEKLFFKRHTTLLLNYLKYEWK